MAARDSVTAAIVRQRRGALRHRRPSRAWGRLTAADWRLVVAVTAAQIATAVALRLMPLHAWRARACRLRSLARFFVRGSDSRIAWAIEATGRRLPRVSTCLIRALVAELVLDAKDGPVSLSIGVRRTPAGTIDAHAWLARGECVLIGATGDEYIPLVTWKSVPV